MPRTRVRPDALPTMTLRVPCADCRTSMSVLVPALGNPYDATYLCPACLDARVAQVQATPTPPERRGRGRPPGRRAPAPEDASL